MSPMSGHVSSDRLGEAAQLGTLDFLRETERRHVQGCDQCRHLYGGYRLTDRLLAAGWRDVTLPPEAAARPSRRAAFADFVSGIDARSLAPAAAAIGIVVLIGSALALPQLIPMPAAGSHSPIASRSAEPTSPWEAPKTVSPSSSVQASETPGTETPGTKTPGTKTPGPSGGPGSSSPSGPTPAPSGSPVKRSLDVTKIAGSPIAWSPDSAHLLLWGSGSPRQLQIRDASGQLTGTAYADAAAWVDSSTIIVATHSSSGSKGHGGGGTGGTGETVSLINVSAHTTSTLSGKYPLSGSVANGMLLGSGSGELTIADQGGWGSPGWGFVLWNGSLGNNHDGLPIAFSQDSGKLAILHPSSVSGGSVTGTLEILSVPSLEMSASFTHLTLRVGSGSLGSGFGFDAAFSPDGRYLLASGTLVDLSSGSSLQVGKGGWLPDGTLVTASDSGVLRWHGTHATADPRLPGLGTVETSRHGELIYFYGDSRPPLLLGTDGTLDALSLTGVRSIDSVLVSPNGRVIALDGRATDGSSITAVAALP